MNSVKWSEVDAAKLSVAVFVVSVLFVAAALLLLASRAWSAHEAGGTQNAPQNLVAHANFAVSAGAPGVVVLDANPERVTAICRNLTGNDLVIGDASTDGTHGFHLTTTLPQQKFDATSAIFAYSLAGATVNCAEVVRP